TGAGRIRADRNRARPDPDPSDLDPRDQHLGQPRAEHGPRPLRGRLGPSAALVVLGGAYSGGRRGRSRLSARREGVARRSQRPSTATSAAPTITPRGYGRGFPAFGPQGRTVSVSDRWPTPLPPPIRQARHPSGRGTRCDGLARRARRAIPDQRPPVAFPP